MISVLTSGILVNKPTQRESRKGNPFVTANITTFDGAASSLVSLVAFDELPRELLLALGKGDTVVVSGPGKVTTWTKRDGSLAFGINITAKSVMSHYQATEKHKAIADAGHSGTIYTDFNQMDIEYAADYGVDVQEDTPF